MTLSIRKVPIERVCFTHNRELTHEVDGTTRRLCRGCISKELRMAEAVLWADRLYHLNHDLKVRGCPFCYPGAVA